MTSPARRLIAAWLALGAAGAIAACTSSNTSTTYTPYTGIDVPTASVIAGIGCAGPAAPDGAQSDGIDHWLAFLTYAPDAGSLDAALLDAASPDASSPDAGSPDASPLETFPDSGIVAAGIFSCYTPTGTFENIDAAATYDVWILGFPSGVPADLLCDAGTCIPNADELGLLLQDQQEAVVMLRCKAVAESGSHPFAYGCEPVGTRAPLDSGSPADAAGDASAADAESPSDANGDGSSAGDSGGD